MRIQVGRAGHARLSASSIYTVPNGVNIACARAAEKDYQSVSLARKASLTPWTTAILLAVTLLQPAAQTQKAMSLIDLAELSRVLDPQLSPDGRFVTYARSHPDWKASRPIWQLWKQEVGGGPPSQLTSPESGIVPGF